MNKYVYIFYIKENKINDGNDDNHNTNKRIQLFKSVPPTTNPSLKQLTDSIIDLRQSTGCGCVWITLEVVDEAPDPLLCTVWSPPNTSPLTGRHKIHGQQCFVLSCLLFVTH